jgi:hypothetical protein
MDFWSLVKDYALTITAFGVIVAIFISLFTLISQKRYNNYQRLIEIFAMDNTIEEREARKNVYDAFRIYMERHYKNGLKISGKMYFAKNLVKFKGDAFLDIFRDPVVLDELKIREFELQQDVERVRVTFDHIGALFAIDLIDKVLVLNALWGTGRVCWICLAQNIFIERDKRQTEFYLNNFESFFYEIEKYRNRHRPKLQPVEPF